MYLYLYVLKMQFNKYPYDREYLRGWLHKHFYPGVKLNNNM